MIDEEKNLLLRTLKKKTPSLKTQSLKDPKENPFNEEPREDPYCCET